MNLSTFITQRYKSTATFKIQTPNFSKEIHLLFWWTGGVGEQNKGDRLVVCPGESAPLTEPVSRCPQPSPLRPRRPHAGLLSATSKAGNKSWGADPNRCLRMPTDKRCGSRKMREGTEAGLSQAQLEAPGEAFDIIVRLHWQRGVRPATWTPRFPATLRASLQRRRPSWTYWISRLPS